MKKILFFLVNIYFVSVFAQINTVRVDLGKHVKVDENRKSNAVIAVFKYPKNPFEEPKNIGLISEKKVPTFEIKFPELPKHLDTCYAYVYFGGYENDPFMTGYEMILISNNSRDNRPCLIFRDKNRNKDYSDDGVPDTFNYKKNYLKLQFTNQSNPLAIYETSISRFEYKTQTNLLNMYDMFYFKNVGKRVFATTFYSFKENRINVVGGDFKLGNDSFRLAIKDQNCNGLYDDDETDVLLLGRYQTEELSEEILTFSKNKKKMYFDRNGNRFFVKEVDPAGNFILIETNENLKAKNVYLLNQKIKIFKFVKVEEKAKTVSIKKYKKKMLYIYVWSTTRNSSFKDDTIYLNKIQSEFGYKINIVTLNYGETPKSLLRFKYRNKVDWVLGLSTDKINKKLYVDDFPKGILTKKRLRVIKNNIAPKELYQLLKDNKI